MLMSLSIERNVSISSNEVSIPLNRVPIFPLAEGLMS